MNKFWVSWYCPEAIGPFTLDSPWWISGIRASDDVPMVCAAVKAESADDAQQIILNSFDKKPESLEWRFCDERDKSWSPFCDRFPRASWMVWTT